MGKDTREKWEVEGIFEGKLAWVGGVGMKWG